MYKKIRPNHKITLIFFLIMFALLEFLLWGLFGTKPWKEKPAVWWVNLIYTGCALVVILVGFIIYIKTVYYIVNDSCISHHASKSIEYYFKNIVYVDEEYSKKHIEVKFYYNDGYWVYLRDSRNKDLLKFIKEKSKLLTYDELNLKYPKAIESNQDK